MGYGNGMVELLEDWGVDYGSDELKMSVLEELVSSVVVVLVVVLVSLVRDLVVGVVVARCRHVIDRRRRYQKKSGSRLTAATLRTETETDRTTLWIAEKRRCLATDCYGSYIYYLRLSYELVS